MSADYQYGGDIPIDDFFRLYGDGNGDGYVDFNDFAGYFLPAFGSSTGQPGFRDDLDIDGDGYVDFDDFAYGFLPNFGMSR